MRLPCALNPRNLLNPKIVKSEMRTHCVPLLRSGGRLRGQSAQAEGGGGPAGYPHARPRVCKVPAGESPPILRPSMVALTIVPSGPDHAPLITTRGKFALCCMRTGSFQKRCYQPTVVRGSCYHHRILVRVVGGMRRSLSWLRSGPGGWCVCYGRSFEYEHDNL